ncbi:class I SAM-dependent methyltransferase [Virgibacillus salexigens]|uniref:SAM-dependent methyltransferase n=2 Tax=Virgibacillus TaxID=84406 RepID=A0ABQ2E104_9BACI|nr:MULTISPECIES: class I SAM-dependent methyltransferase [Virgibacillus]MYL42631.1 methyltransferase domain-containing protein [Virgibacillus massiliensis]GGJ75638.1 SAM-dependent methyltransferase [Virgibacillus kapii]CDQ40515.1 putative methyltransferase YcgJ [Virgibacillus massiliensis]
MNHKNHSKPFSNIVYDLDNPKRRESFPPERLLDMLPIKRTDTILDVGAGTGYLTIPAANLVDGQVYALDINPKMLELIKTKTEKDTIENVHTIRGTIDNIPLADASIDIVLASIVLHEVQPLSNALQQIKQVLREDGYFVCVEFEEKEFSPNGPPRISSSDMEQALINAGFHITEKFSPNELLYIIIAKTPFKAT